MNERLSRDEVARVALLARLKLSEDELTEVNAQMSKVLEYIAVLDEVDTADVEPMVHAIEVANVFRPDVVSDSLPREDALSNAPKTDGQYYLVPAILDGE